MDKMLHALIKLVYEFPGLTGRDYARILRDRGFLFATKTDVNHILYGYPSFFKANADSNFKPAWTTTQSAQLFIQNKQPEFDIKGKPEVIITSEQKPKTITPFEIQPEKKSKKYTESKNQEKCECNIVLDERLKLYDWQKRALEYWKSENCRAIIQAVTGSGKTRLALAAIDSFLQQGLSQNENWKVLIIVPTIDLMDQWNISIREDLLLPLDRPYKIGFLGDGKRQGLQHIDILIGTSNSVQNYRTLPKGCKGLIIGDECHQYGTQNSIKMLEKEYKYRLGLTAYLERIGDNGVEDIIVPYFGSNEYHYGYAEAIDDGVIASFEITFIIAEMSDSEKVEMEELNTHITKLNRSLVGKYPNLKNASTDQFWAQINKLAGFDKGARVFRNLIYKRRSDVVKLKSKFLVYSHLVDLIKRSKGAFGFTQIIETADEVVRILCAYKIKCRKFDGQIDQRIRKQVLSSFKNHELDMLVAPKLLDQGIDVPTANLAIITGRNSSMRQTIQRIGRVVRRKDENGKGYIVIIASKDTIEDPNNIDQEAFYEIFNDSQIKINKFQFPSQINEIEEHFKKWEL